MLVDRRQSAAVGVELASPPCLPRMSCRHELRRADRQGVAGEVDLLAPDGIELRVGPLPPVVSRTPVLRSPVILEPARSEIRAETASGPRRRTRGAQERDREPAEGVATCPDAIR